MSVPDYFLWLDLETTGLDEKDEVILEVAWVVTDSNLQAVTAPATFVVKPEDQDWAVIGGMNDFVKKMHTGNNLLAEVEFASFNLDEVLGVLRDDLIKLRDGNPDAEIRLSGRSVHFDERFLRANGYEHLFDKYISHRHHDLSSIKTYLDMRGIVYDDIQGPDHRALGDVLADLDFARHLQTVDV